MQVFNISETQKRKLSDQKVTLHLLQLYLQTDEIM